MKDYGNGGDIVLCDLNFSDWMPVVFNALSDQAHAYFMTNGRNLSAMQAAGEDAGFRIHTVLVWDKRAALPNKYYQNVTEFGLFMFKGKAKTINNPGSRIWFQFFNVMNLNIRPKSQLSLCVIGLATAVRQMT
jgi:site-specific DNA-methyltransferase (adenine-specific)